MAEGQVFVGKEFELTPEMVVDVINFHQEQIDFCQRELPDEVHPTLIRDYQAGIESNGRAIEKLQATSGEDIVEGARYVFDRGVELEQAGLSTVEIAAKIAEEVPDILDYYQLLKKQSWGYKLSQVVMTNLFNSRSQG